MQAVSAFDWVVWGLVDARDLAVASRDEDTCRNHKLFAVGEATAQQVALHDAIAEQHPFGHVIADLRDVFRQTVEHLEVLRFRLRRVREVVPDEHVLCIQRRYAVDSFGLDLLEQLLCRLRLPSSP